ncbi:hypothetical protein FRB95_012358 [Tulasnella sp. JGI-2019a]|nr:hypothetical protein FRB95_012358 [Tulasnella sp. JGI-2019a]
MSTALILSASDVDKLVKDITPDQLMDLMKDVFRTLSHPPSPDSIQTPHRTSIDMPRHTTLFMPSRLSSSGTTAIKIVSVPKEGGTDGIPATTVVMDETTGGIKAILNARNLTALRTAAGSLLATSIIKPKSTSNDNMTLVCFGAGAQIAAHIQLLLTYYTPRITQCVIVNRSANARLEALQDNLRREHPNVGVSSIVSSLLQQRQRPHDGQVVLEAVVRSADIIVTATSSTSPLFPSHWVKPQTHINLIGSYKPVMREIDSDLVARAKVILVDSKTACAKEAGELIGNPGIVGEDGEIRDTRVVELGAYVAVGGGSGAGVGDGDVTIFKSVGVGAQDVAIASLVVQMAEQKNAGTTLPFEN